MEPNEALDVDPQALEGVLMKLEMLKRAAEQEMDYAKAQVITSGIAKVKSEMLEFKRQQFEQMLRAEKEGLNEATEELSMRMAVEWEAREVVAREEQLRQLEALKRKHRDERAALDERTHDKMRPESFKGSPALQALEKKHQGHARLGEYEKAHEAKEQWIAMEGREKEAWQRRIYNAYVEQLERLQARHGMEVRVLLESQEAAARKFNAERARALEMAQRRYANAVRDVERKYAVLLTNTRRYGGLGAAAAATAASEASSAPRRPRRATSARAGRPSAPATINPSSAPAPRRAAPPRARSAPSLAAAAPGGRRASRRLDEARVAAAAGEDLSAGDELLRSVLGSEPPAAAPEQPPPAAGPATPASASRPPRGPSSAGRPPLPPASSTTPLGPTPRRGSASSGPSSSREASPSRRFEEVYSTPRSRPLSAPRSRPPSAKGRSRSPASPAQVSRHLAELDSMLAAVPRADLAAEAEVHEPPSPEAAAAAAAEAAAPFDFAPDGVIEAAEVDLGIEALEAAQPVARPKNRRPVSGRIGSFM